MDRSQFDAFTRLLGTSRSRRRALTALLGAVVLGHDSAPTLAKHGKHKGRHTRRGAGDCDGCEDGEFCCGGRCVPRRTNCCSGRVCRQDQVCRNGTCKTCYGSCHE